MKVSIKNNVLTITTGINAEAAKNQDTTLTDEKGNVIYKVFTALEGNPDISATGIVCNNIVDGELAVTMLLPVHRPDDYIKRAFGKELITAKKYLPAIAERVAANEAELEAIVAVIEE